METIKRKSTLLIHGNSSSSNVYKEILLINQELNLITINLLGHRNNETTPMKEFTLSYFREDLLAKINSIRGDKLVIGHSLGGHLAIGIADQIIDLKGLVVFGTTFLKKPLNLEEAFQPNPLLNTFLSENPRNEDVEDLIFDVIQNKSIRNLVIDDFKSTNPRIRSAIEDGLAKGDYEDEYKVFTKLKIPKYILISQYDTIPNPKYLRKVANDCNGSCRVINIDNSGHYPSLETPVEFLEIVQNITTEVFLK